MPGAVGGAANGKPVYTLISKGASSWVDQTPWKGRGYAVPCVGPTSSQAGQPAHVPATQGSVRLPPQHCTRGTPQGNSTVPDTSGQRADPRGTTYFGRILAANMGVGTGTVPTLEDGRGNWQHRRRDQKGT